MKKFFNRFSTTVDKGGVDALARQITNDSMAEKMPMQSSSPIKEKSSSGERVKLLAAQFETLSAAEPKQQQRQLRNGTQPALPLRSSSQRRPNRIDTDSPPLPNNDAVLQPRTNEDTPSETSEADLLVGEEENVKRSPMLSSSNEPNSSLKIGSSMNKQVTDHREATGSSSTSHQQQGNAKTVAFAPSPKKPVRASSPPPPMPTLEDVQTFHIGNFAKATAASTARSRAIPRNQNASEGTSSLLVPSQTPLTAGQNISRPSSSLSTNQQHLFRRNSSSSTPGRRGSNSWIGGGDPLPNSIPFVSSTTNSHIRSASPQSIDTNSSSKPTGYHIGSNRGSWTGRLNSAGSTSQGWASSGAKSIGGPSWSEMTQDDLVCNLGARERTRQEVLWEIVASEERYVKELERTKEFYLDALLHPHRFSNTASANHRRSSGENVGTKQRNSLHQNTLGDLPIAARFMGSDFSGQDAIREKEEQARSSNVRQSKTEGVNVNNPSTPKSSRTTTKTSNPKRWSNGRLTDQDSGAASSQVGYAITGGDGLFVPLPPSLRITLEAISNGLLVGHLLLSEALKHRYEEQWPLVRSLADVFSRYAHVLQHYKDYVVHLERALDSLEEAALMERAMRGKRLKKEKLTMTVGLGRAVASLEAAAMERGECSLAIFLAMPFQRLLKYPLLFQNLLFHTDASTYEFESTVKMVVDIEETVRSIEDEKADKEERDKTLDAFARIDLIRDKALLRPKRDRILVEEKALYGENPRRAISESNEGAEGSSNSSLGNQGGLSSQNAAGTLKAALKSKRSYRRLSDFLTVEDRPSQATKAPNMGSKKDLWLVRFSDVELKCQRVGVTALPMVSSVVLQPLQTSGGKVDDEEVEAAMTEEEAKIKEEFKRSKESKERIKALRNTTLRSKTRNLYKFISVTSWKQVQKEKGAEGDSPLEGLASPQEVDEEEEEEEDGDEDEEDDKGSNTSQETDIGVLDMDRYVRQSKLSFSYWGQDKVEPKPMTRTQSQNTNSVANFRSAKESVNPKRHSLTSRIPISPALSTKVVTSNSHARSKMDKFGHRMRQTTESNSNGLQRISSSSPSSSPRPTSVARINGGSTNDVRNMQQQQSREESPSSPTNKLFPIHQQRSYLARDHSIDSNLRLIGTFINNNSEDDGGSSTLY